MKIRKICVSGKNFSNWFKGRIKNVVEWSNPLPGPENSQFGQYKDIRKEHQSPQDYTLQRKFYIATLLTIAVVINFKRDFRSAFDFFVLIAFRNT